MERERERSLGRDGSLGRHGDLRGAELVQVAERQLSQIQHVHGYVTHTHITPAQVTSAGSPQQCAKQHTHIVSLLNKTLSTVTFEKTSLSIYKSK